MLKIAGNPMLSYTRNERCRGHETDNRDESIPPKHVEFFMVKHAVYSVFNSEKPVRSATFHGHRWLKLTEI
jgi:hypothetical protein